MSMLSPQRQGRGADKVGETVASFPTYEGAQKAVSSLIAGEVPARHIAIVGMGLRSIERITGRLGYATAARTGALNGVLLGVLFGMILVLGSPVVPIQAFVGVVFVGVAIGMLLNIVMYSFIRRRRDFASVMQVVADHYEVTVDGDSLAKARAVLGRSGAPGAPAASPSRPSAAGPASAAPSGPAGGSAGAPAAPAPLDTSPPRYGQRVPAGQAAPTNRAAPANPAGTASPAGPTVPAVDAEPPRYGQRITPAGDRPAAPPASAPAAGATTPPEPASAPGTTTPPEPAPPIPSKPESTTPEAPADATGAPGSRDTPPPA